MGVRGAGGGDEFGQVRAQRTCTEDGRLGGIRGPQRSGECRLPHRGGQD